MEWAENLATVIYICAPIAVSTHVALLALSMFQRAARAV